MGYAQKILPHYTYEDWLQWEGKWELIDGVAIAMSPLPIPKHQWVASSIRAALYISLKKASCKKCLVYDPLDYKIAEDTILAPDIVLVCGDIKKKYLDFAPSLVVEILSPATALRDRHVKFEIYRSQGVKYYLIVDSDNETIEIYALVNGGYQLQPFSKTYPFILDDGCEITADFGEVWE